MIALRLVEIHNGEPHRDIARIPLDGSTTRSAVPNPLGGHARSAILASGTRRHGLPAPRPRYRVSKVRHVSGDHDRHTDDSAVRARARPRGNSRRGASRCSPVVADRRVL